MAIRAGWRAAWQTYRQEYFIAEQEYDWGDWESRLARYWHNRRYVDNTIYSAVNAYLSVFKNKEKLYKHIRGLRNPIYRLTQIEAAKVLGGVINYETFADGAIPLLGADDTLKEAIRTIYQWSNMDTMKTTLVRAGSSMGDIALKVVDDLPRQKVRIEILDPRKVADVVFDSSGNIKECTILYLMEDRETGADVEYKEIITKDSFMTFRDGHEHAFDWNVNLAGTPVSEWENPYGFVPVRWIKHVDVERNFGATSFHSSRSKIDNLNDLVSKLHTNMSIQAMPKWAITAAGLPKQDSSPSTINMSTDGEDKAPFIPIGKDSNIMPITYNADIANGLELAIQLQEEIEADLPQLALQRMRKETGNASGVAIENLYSDANDIIEELQANYVAGLRAATQMAISMAAFRGYDGFSAYSLDSYESGSLDFDIRPKSLFKHQLNTKEKVELTNLALKSDAPRLMLEQLGYSEAQINDALMAKDDIARQQVRAAFSDLMRLDDMPNDSVVGMNAIT